MSQPNAFWRQPLFTTYLLPRLTGTFLVRLVAQGMGFATSLLLTRWLGASGYGVYAFAFAMVTLAALPASLGWRSLLTREMAQYSAAGNWSAAKGLLRLSWQSTLLAAILVGGIVLTISWLFTWPADASLREGMRWALLSLPFFALVPVWQGSLTGWHQTHRAQIPEAIVRPLVLLLVLLIVYQIQGVLAYPMAIAVNIMAMAAASLVSIGLLIRYRPATMAAVKPYYHTRRWLRSSVLFLLISGMHLFNTHTDMLMIGTWLDAEAAGIYQIPVRLGGLLLFPFIVLEMVLAPLMAKAHAEQNLPQLTATIRRMVGLVFVVTVVAGAILYLSGNTVLGWFGPAFPAGRQVLFWIVIMVGVQVMFGPVGYLTSMTGNEHITTRVMGMSAIINIALNSILIPRYGIEGAAVATLCSELVWKGLLYGFVRRYLGLRPGVLPF